MTDFYLDSIARLHEADAQAMEAMDAWNDGSFADYFAGQAAAAMKRMGADDTGPNPVPEVVVRSGRDDDGQPSERDRGNS